jgi:Zn-dependent peptidase ImmA (M78 family)
MLQRIQKKMDQTPNDLEDLAESIGLNYLINGRVYLDAVVAEAQIRIVRGNYGKCFTGMLVCENNQFYIQLNLEELRNNLGRTRFTIAHELGHYYTDSHRIQLLQGISMSYHADWTCNSNIIVEKQANNFASALLMPKSIFFEQVAKYEPGLNCIFNMKGYFDTSIESTAMRYTALNIVPCMMVKWTSELSFNYVYYSKSLSDKAGMNNKPVIKVAKNYIREVIKQLPQYSDIPQIFEVATQLSKWVATIIPGSKQDLVGLEQTIKLGRYGAITLLIFP